MPVIYGICSMLPEQLEQLAPCVRKLHEVTERIRKDKIESFTCELSHFLKGVNLGDFKHISYFAGV